MRLTHCKTQNMARNSENVKNEKYTLQDLNQGKKTEKTWKRKTHSVGREIWQEKEKNVKNEKYTVQDLDYGKETLKTGKGDTITV